MLEELLIIEREYWLAAGDPEFYRQNFAEDGVMAFHVGILDKDDVVAAMAGSDEWEHFTIDEPRLVEISPDVAALVYTTVAVSQTTSDEYRAVVVSVYARRDGRWQLVMHQQSPRA